MYHRPVLLSACIEGLNIHPEGVYADVTFGGGGHSRAILEKLSTGHLYAFDQDEDAAKNAIDNKHPLPTTQEKTLDMDITRWSTPKSD